MASFRFQRESREIASRKYRQFKVQDRSVYVSSVLIETCRFTLRITRKGYGTARLKLLTDEKVKQKETHANKYYIAKQIVNIHALRNRN